MVGVGDLDGGMFHSEAYGVSADGSVVVGRGNSAQGFEAFRWQNDVMIGLGDLDGGSFYSWAQGVSADGSVVVGHSFSTSHLEAFIWEETSGMRSLQDVLTGDYGVDLTGWWLRTAQAISDDGRTIVGYGDNPDGNIEAWMVKLDIIPEPSTLIIWSLLGAFGLAAGCWRRRRRAA